MKLLLPQANLAAHERVPDGNQLEKKLGEEYLLCTNKTLRTLLPVSSDWYHQEQCQLYDHTTSFWCRRLFADASVDRLACIAKVVVLEFSFLSPPLGLCGPLLGGEELILDWRKSRRCQSSLTPSLRLFSMKGATHPLQVFRAMPALCVPCTKHLPRASSSSRSRASPRAMPYFCKGERDLFTILVLLTICQEIDACFGPLLPTFSTPRNIPKMRFHGNFKCNCKALSHQAFKLRVHA